METAENIIKILAYTTAIIATLFLVWQFIESVRYIYHFFRDNK